MPASQQIEALAVVGSDTARGAGGGAAGRIGREGLTEPRPPGSGPGATYDWNANNPGGRRQFWRAEAFLYSAARWRPGPARGAGRRDHRQREGSGPGFGD